MIRARDAGLTGDNFETHCSNCVPPCGPLDEHAGAKGNLELREDYVIPPPPPPPCRPSFLVRICLLLELLPAGPYNASR